MCIFFIQIFIGVVYKEVRDVYKVYKAPKNTINIVAESSYFSKTLFVRGDCKNKYGCEYLTLISKDTQKKYILNVDKESISSKEIEEINNGANVSFENISEIYTKKSGMYGILSISNEDQIINGARLKVDGKEIVPKFGYKTKSLILSVALKTSLIVMLLMFLIFTNKNAYKIKTRSKEIGLERAISENKFWNKK